MSEKCKYCNYISKCSKYCEYNSIMCKVYRSFPKVVEKSYEELQQENQQLKIQISAREEEYKKLEETNKILSQELTKDKILKQDHLTTCCGIPIRDMQKLIKKNKKLEDNWNKLKEYINEEITLQFYNDKLPFEIIVDGILNKMQELERGVSDVED